MYRIDNWINEEIACRIKKLQKRTNQHQKNDQKCFLWCHVRHINPIKIHPKRITREDKRLVNDFDYNGVEFPVQRKRF